MPSPDRASVDLPIDTFGGLVTQIDPQQLPNGASPFNHDIVYSGENPTGNGRVAGLGTRPGLAPFYAAPFAGNPTVNYLAQFADNMGVIHLLSLDGLGVMRDESPCPAIPGVPTQIGQVVAACVAQSDSMIGQEWIAFSDVQHPAFGIDIPRHYDGTNFDRVSQVGPGASPTVEDAIYSLTLDAAPSGLLPVTDIAINLTKVGTEVTLNLGGITDQQLGDQITITGNVDGYDGTYTLIRIEGVHTWILSSASATALPASVGGTIWGGLVFATSFAGTFPAPFAAYPGMEVTIAGATDATYDGTYLARNGTTNLVTIYAPASSGIASGGGTATAIGHIGAGLHLMSVCFITRSQYITKPAPYTQWTTAGSALAKVTQIPIGPANVIARLLIFTPVITPPAVLGNFYYIPDNIISPGGPTYPSMIIPDNTTTTAFADFSDAVLILSTLATDLFELVELGECASVITYSGRTFWAGERNKIQNLLNPTFDGGFSGNTPLGWTQFDAGGSKESADVIWGDAYKITGDGVSINRGTIFQSVYKDFLGVPIISPRTAYSMRVRLKKGGGIVAGSMEFDLVGGSGTGSLVVPVANISSTEYTEFIAPLIPAQTQILPSATFSFYLTGTANLGGYVLVENIEIFPTNQPYNRPLVRGSYAGDPESFNNLTGILLPSDASSESIRGMFTLLDNKLYIISDTGLYVTQDDGKNEPYQWAINTVSARVGMESVLGVDVGESWAILAANDGAYIFWGSEPVKISHEIQPDWDTINWAYSQKMYVLVDSTSQRVHIGVPTGESTICNKEFVMDYSQLTGSELTSAQEIASAPQVDYVNGTLVVNRRSRKWTIWNISANCAALVERTPGNVILLRGNSAGNGKVYNQLVTQLSDDGVAINGEYQTYYGPQEGEADVLGVHRKLCKYMTGYCFGVGTMTFTMEGAQNQRPMSLSSLTLQNPAQADWEKNVNFIAERMSLLIGTNAVGEWFTMSKLSLTLQRDLVSPVRGNNL